MNSLSDTLSQDDGQAARSDSQNRPHIIYPIQSDYNHFFAVGAADLDGDFFPELIITQDWGHPIFMRRNSPSDEAFAVIEVLHQGLPAIGAIVDVHTNSGEVHRHQVRTDGGYAATRPAVVLCPKPQAVREVRIEWPDGHEDVNQGPLSSGLIRFSK